jgi:hypothetical protein
MNQMTESEIYSAPPPFRAASSANEAARMAFPEIGKHFDAF